MIYVFLFLFGIQEFETETPLPEDLAEILAELKENPVDINRANVKELQKIPWIDERLARNIVKYRKKRPFKRKEDLLKVKGMSMPILVKISPYIKVGKISVIRVKKRKKPFLKQRFRIKVKDGEYKSYYKLQIFRENLKAFLLSDEDPEENGVVNYLTGKSEKFVPDYLNFGVQIENLYNLDKIIIGAYTLSFGERLVLGSPAMSVKGTGLVKSKEKGALLYALSGENLGLFGLCMQGNIKRVLTSYLFLSLNKIDGEIEDNKIVPYFLYEADHSTISGEERKDALTEGLMGFRAEYRKMNKKFGLTFYYSQIVKDTFTLKNYPVGLDYLFDYDDYRIFGEFGYSKSFANITGFEYSYKSIAIRFLYRNIPYNYTSPHASPFTDKKPDKEGRISDKGFYIETEFKTKKFGILAYFDVFSYPQAVGKYLMPMMAGFERRIIANFKPSKGIELQINFKFKQKDNVKAEWKRFEFSFSPLPHLSFDFRSEIMKQVSDKVEKGDLSFVGIRYSFGKFYLKSRYILFDVEPSYPWKIYEFEDEIPGSMTTMGLSGEGKRFYFVFGIKIMKNLSFHSKFGITEKCGEPLSTSLSLQLDNVFYQ